MLQPRVALAAVGSEYQLWVQNIVICIVSAMSMLGAGWIMLSFAIFPTIRTFRHQLILGLAISDFLMALNFMSSTSMNLAGRFIGAPEQRTFCNINGFGTQFFVIQTDYWVLSIAICTFFLIADRRRPAKWVQDHRPVVFAIPWIVSATWAILGLCLKAYDNIGAWCWFGSDLTRLLANFLPRWVIVIAILGVYLRLWWIIYRVQRQFSNIQVIDGVAIETVDDDTIWSPKNEPDGTKDTDPRSPKSPRSPRHSRTSRSSRPGRPSPQLKKLAYQMMTYPVAYMLIWIIPTSIRIYQSITGEPAPTPVATTDKACIVIQGFMDAIIYGYNESALGAWKRLFKGQRERLDSSDSGVNV